MTSRKPASPAGYVIPHRLQGQSIQSLMIILIWLVLLNVTDAFLIQVFVKTEDVAFAGTDNSVYLSVNGSQGIIDSALLDNNFKNDFERDQLDEFSIKQAGEIGEVCGVIIRKSGSNLWKLDYVRIVESKSGTAVTFRFNEWIESEKKYARTRKVNGKWGIWGEWSKCILCGGYQSSHRQCDNPQPACGGEACVGTDVDTVACPADDCVFTETTKHTTTTISTYVTSTADITFPINATKMPDNFTAGISIMTNNQKNSTTVVTTMSTRENKPFPRVDPSGDNVNLAIPIATSIAGVILLIVVVVVIVWCCLRNKRKPDIARSRPDTLHINPTYAGITNTSFINEEKQEHNIESAISVATPSYTSCVDPYRDINLDPKNEDTLYTMIDTNEMLNAENETVDNNYDQISTSQYDFSNNDNMSAHKFTPSLYDSPESPTKNEDHVYMTPNENDIVAASTVNIDKHDNSKIVNPSAKCANGAAKMNTVNNTRKKDDANVFIQSSDNRGGETYDKAMFDDISHVSSDVYMNTSLYEHLYNTPGLIRESTAISQHEQMNLNSRLAPLASEKHSAVTSTSLDTYPNTETGKKNVNKVSLKDDFMPRSSPGSVDKTPCDSRHAIAESDYYNDELNSEYILPMNERERNYYVNSGCEEQDDGEVSSQIPELCEQRTNSLIEEHVYSSPDNDVETTSSVQKNNLTGYPVVSSPSLSETSGLENATHYLDMTGSMRRNKQNVQPRESEDNSVVWLNNSMYEHSHLSEA